MRKIKKSEIANMAVIGKGACATIYKLEDDKVLKLYDKGDRNTAEFVKNEFDISTEIYNLGITTAKTYELCECDGIYGAVYEFVSGDTMLDMIEKEGNLSDFISDLSDIGKQIHSNSVDTKIFPKATELLERLIVHIKPWVNDEQYKHIEMLIDAIPDDNTLIHGDFHPGNIIIRQGKPILIDVGGASHGHPVFDFISMHRMMKKEVFSKVSDGIFAKIYDEYIVNYFDQETFEMHKDSYNEIMDIMYYLTVVPSVCVSYGKRENCDIKIVEYVDFMIGILLKMDITRFKQLFTDTQDLFKM